MCEGVYQIRQSVASEVSHAASEGKTACRRPCSFRGQSPILVRLNIKGSMAMGKVTIDQGLLAILCCPETKQEVTLAPDELVSKVNGDIERGQLRNRAKQPVNEKIDGGLLRADKKILYPVRDNIPVMLIDEGIPLEGAP